MMNTIMNSMDDDRREENRDYHGNLSNSNNDSVLQFCLICEKSFPTIALLVKHDTVHHSNRKGSSRKKSKPTKIVHQEDSEMKDAKPFENVQVKSQIGCHGNSNNISGTILPVGGASGSEDGADGNSDDKNDKKNGTDETEICQKSFKSQSDLEKHRNTHKKPTVLFVCSICGDCNFKTANGLAKHQKQHGIKQFAIKCSECGKGFFKHCELRDHMNLHTGATPYNCETCGKLFPLRSRLKSHLKSHTRPYSCKQCGKTYQQLRHLQKHERWHTGEKPFNCTICGKNYTSKDHLNSHMKIHNNERNHACATCGKKFLNKGDVNKHALIHSGAKPFDCEFCGLSFRQRGHLTTHIRVHKGLKPFMCTECGKTFTTSTGLKNHRINEKGLKPYCCEICNVRFNRLDKLKRHLRIHRNRDDGGEQSEITDTIVEAPVQDFDAESESTNSNDKFPVLSKLLNESKEKIIEESFDESLEEK